MELMSLATFMVSQRPYTQGGKLLAMTTHRCLARVSDAYGVEVKIAKDGEIYQIPAKVAA
jgi:hypothetical protein